MSRGKPCEKSTNSRDLRASMFPNQKHGNDMTMLVAHAIPREKCELLTQPKDYISSIKTCVYFGILSGDLC